MQKDQQFGSVAAMVLKGGGRNENPETDLAIKGFNPKCSMSTCIEEGKEKQTILSLREAYGTMSKFGNYLTGTWRQGNGVQSRIAKRS